MTAKTEMQLNASFRQVIANGNRSFKPLVDYRFVHALPKGSGEKDCEALRQVRGVGVVFPESESWRRILTCTQDGLLRVFDTNLMPVPWGHDVLGSPVESFAYWCSEAQLDLNSDDDPAVFIALGCIDGTLHLCDWYGHAFIQLTFADEVFALRFAEIGGRLVLLAAGRSDAHGFLAILDFGSAESPQPGREPQFMLLPETLWSLCHDADHDADHACLFLGGGKNLYDVRIKADVDGSDIEVSPWRCLSPEPFGEIRGLELLRQVPKPRLALGTSSQELILVEIDEGCAVELDRHSLPGWVRRLASVPMGASEERLFACTDTGGLLIFRVVCEPKPELRFEWALVADREVREAIPYKVHANGMAQYGLFIVARFGGIRAYLADQQVDALDSIKDDLPTPNPSAADALDLDLAKCPMLDRRQLRLLCAGIGWKQVRFKDSGPTFATLVNTSGRVRSLALLRPETAEAAPRVVVGWGPHGGASIVDLRSGAETPLPQVGGWGFTVATGYAAGRDQVLVGGNALMAFTPGGELLWRYGRDPMPGGGIAVCDGLVFSAGVDGDLYLFDGSNSDSYLARYRLKQGVRSRRWLRNLDVQRYADGVWLLATGGEDGAVDVVLVQRTNQEGSEYVFYRIGHIQTQGFTGSAVRLLWIDGEWVVFVGSTDGYLYAARIRASGPQETQSGNRNEHLFLLKRYWKCDDFRNPHWHSPDWIKSLDFERGAGEPRLLVGSTDQYVYRVGLDGHLLGILRCVDEVRALAYVPSINGAEEIEPARLVLGSEAGGAYSVAIPDGVWSAPSEAATGVASGVETTRAQAFFDDLGERIKISDGAVRQFLKERAIIDYLIQKTQNWMGTDSFDQNVKALREAIKNQTPIAFIGAGLSQEVGLPSANQLRDALGRMMHKPEGFFSDLAEAAQYYTMRGSGDRKLAEDVEDLLEQRRQQKSPQVSLNLLRLLGFRILVSTNYDALIEEAFCLDRRSVITEDLDFLNGAPLQGDKPVLYKIHGDFAHPQHLDLSLEHYLRQGLKREDVDFRMRSLFIDHPVLFVGYSLNDLDVQRLIYEISKKLGDSCQQVYIVLHEDSAYTRARASILKSLMRDRPEKLAIFVCDTRLFLAYLLSRM